MTTDPALSRLAELRKLLAEKTGGAWFIEETDDWWELYAVNAHPELAQPHNPRGEMHPWKIAKCAKRGQAFAEYWPNDADAGLIVALVNNAEWLLDASERGEAYRVANDGLGNLCRTAAAENAALRERVEDLEHALQHIADSPYADHDNMLGWYARYAAAALKAGRDEG